MCSLRNIRKYNGAKSSAPGDVDFKERSEVNLNKSIGNLKERSYLVILPTSEKELNKTLRCDENCQQQKYGENIIEQ